MQIMATDGQLILWRSVLTRQWFRRVWIVVLCIAVLCVVVCGQPVYAVDELYLTGVVKNINPITGIVYVDVTSDSCRGMRIFRADDLGKLGNYVNQAISFYIDSSTCGDNNVHMILVSRGISK